MNKDTYKVLENYIKEFESLHCDKKMGVAPHKAILLLAIINLYDFNIIKDNIIFPSPELLRQFTLLWEKYVTTKHLKNFAMPFFHMKSESFWQLIFKQGYEDFLSTKKKVKSLKQLEEKIYCARIDLELANLLTLPFARAILKGTLIQTFFPTKDLYNILEYDDSYVAEIETEIIEEAPAKYITKLEKILNSLSKTDLEEEFYIRGSVFKRLIPKVYNYKCAITGLKIHTPSNISLIDACHIKPFSESHNDTITNGIALTPTIHRAFDRGLITITSNYRVLVSEMFVELGNSNFSIKQLNNIKLNLPDNPTFSPSKDSLEWHYENIFLK
jgi:putative restriction endonuclease